LPLQELLRRLKSILCKKPGVYASTGVRPLLQDLQGIPRDPSPSSIDMHIFGQYNKRTMSKEDLMDKRLNEFCSQLQCLHDIGKVKGGFGVDKKEFDGLTSAIKACACLDTDHFRTMYKEWYSLCKKQQVLSTGKYRLNDNNEDQGKQDEKVEINSEQLSFEELAEEMRKAEIEVSIAMASRQALSVVQQRINQIEKDRIIRFEILKEMLDEICVREMDFRLELKLPSKDSILELPRITTVSGIFDFVLEMTGEI
jgi:hypothetical protein